MNSEISDDDEEDEVREEAVANYDLRSKTGEEKRQVVKPLKWPVLKEWNVKPSEVLEMQKEDSTLDQYWRTAKGDTGVKGSNQANIQLVIKRGVLYRKHREVLRDDISLQLMVPEKLRNRVLHMAHESLMSAHQGIRCTQEKISVIFYWLDMLRDVKRHVTNCK